VKEKLTVALVGNPNCGKTSLFNALTGLHHKVSNFPGTTVEKIVGSATLSKGVKADVVDLPGTYSLYPKSADELVTSEMLRNHAAPGYPDVAVFIADASNLKRNLLLFTQVCDMGIPVIIAMNMVDVAERRGVVYDYDKLENILKVNIIPINARKKDGINNLKSAILDKSFHKSTSFLNLETIDSNFKKELSALCEKPNHYSSIQYAINAVTFNFKESKQILQLFATHNFDSYKFQEKEILDRYRAIDYAIRTTRLQKPETLKASLTKKVDKILTHRIWGITIFLGILFSIFQAIFSWSSYPMGWIETGFTILEDFIRTTLPQGVLNDLLVNGILAGLSGVMVFLPQILVLFLFIAVLEDVGYMARVSFIMDRIMRPFGMNGRSVVPLVGGIACAVPSIMACRSIENPRERLITVMVIPLMSCSARLPVYTVLIAMLLPNQTMWGIVNVPGLVLMAMYLLGFFAALLSAVVFKMFSAQKQKNYFIMELPGYKIPLLGNVLSTLYEKGAAFVYGAGKIIVLVSVILWVLASTGPGNNLEIIEKKYETQISSLSKDVLYDAKAQELSLKKGGEMLSASYAGEFGKLIEPAIAPIGFDWKIGIALLTSLAAREVFVGTMATIYSVSGGEDNISAIKDKMLSDINPNTGKPVYGLANILSLLVFYAFAMQCMSTLAVTAKETGSFKWPLLQFIYMTCLAYGSSLLVYNLF